MKQREKERVGKVWEGEASWKTENFGLLTTVLFLHCVKLYY